VSEHVVPTESSDAEADALGLNSWLVEEKYQEFLTNPGALSADWREAFSSGHRPSDLANGAKHAPEVGSDKAVPSAPVNAEAPKPEAPKPEVVAPSFDEPVTPLRGVAQRIVENMVASLSVPTATSVHPVPATLLDVNRKHINDHLAKSGSKVSFTHLIAFAVLKGLAEVPALNSSFVADADGKGTPGVIRHAHVGLGIAIDLERSGGGRSLLVPAIRNADSYDFAGFVAAYEQVVAKARTNKLTPEDFAGVTVTITNPGTLGTTQSVPRLMNGQGAIIGIGALDYPAEYQATDPETLSQLGVGKVLTLTSTYDHRIIQGAESGLFLKYVHELLIGEHGFYDEIFTNLSMADSPARWQRDRRPTTAENEVDLASFDKQLAVRDLIDAYRRNGHVVAQLDPLGLTTSEPPLELDPATFGLSMWDLDRNFATGGLAGEQVMPLSRILEILKAAYCGTVGVEYWHIDDPAEQRWIQERIEAAPEALSQDEQRNLLERLTVAEVFETFLHTRYIGQTRFSLEGGEATIPFLDALLEQAVHDGIEEAVIGMAHRGRLNTLVNIMGRPYEEIFADFQGTPDLTNVQNTGDVKYHKGGTGKWTGRTGVSLPVTMPPNPSHLEAIDPVVEGIVRAKLDRLGVDGRDPILPILIHGDASMAGQGIVFETLQLSALEGFETGGTVHLVINNQLGFTTPPTSGRSTRYATEVAKAVGAPIFHVNGDDPEAVVRVARLAGSYREAFKKDVVVDLVCYRQHGHNEGDDPSYTQPLIYKAVEARPTPRQVYAESLARRGIVGEQEAEQIKEQITAHLQAALDAIRAQNLSPITELPARERHELQRLAMPTGVERATLDAIAKRLDVVPPGFTIHPKLERQFQQRVEMYNAGEVDWATGEALAIGSLLLEGTDVRLSGQDSRRGTFSHRHAVLVDYENGTDFAPLNALGLPIGDLPPLAPQANVARFQVRDSLLSEYAVMGFEYGYSVEDPNALVMWEAQYGDFSNGAQIIIDNFLTSAEEKWGQYSGLVLLLPHGYEGQGPEHSSARIERFLGLAADANIAVVQPTNSAQYFHVLRAQARRTPRRPLIVIAPKSLLRARQARAPIGEFVSGSFAEVLDDPARGVTLDNSAVTRVVLCSGKVAFQAMDRRDAIAKEHSFLAPSAVIRLEQLFPWPEAQLVDVLDRYPNAEELIWLQDEPENMGPWGFAQEQLRATYRDRLRIRKVARAAGGSPSTGSREIHELEVEHLLEEAIGPKPATK
jgi:2-oxoglutarate dehydrogenase E1 component